MGVSYGVMNAKLLMSHQLGHKQVKVIIQVINFKTQMHVDPSSC